MSRSKLIMIGMTVGSIAGGYLPTFFGADWLSYASVIGNAAGGLIGVWITYKLTQNF